MNRIVALFLLIILGPFFLIIAVLIKCDSRGPVFFKQKRLGLKEKGFLIFKFRTLYVGAPICSGKERDLVINKYITPLGKWLRKRKFDEFPQLFNIVKGQMNFIGPRPLLESAHGSIIGMRKKFNIYEVKPGLTGLVALLNIHDDKVSQMAICDRCYIKHKSLRLDIKIIFLTIQQVLRF